MDEPELGDGGLGLNLLCFPLLQTALPFIPFMTKDAERPTTVTYLPHKFCVNGHPVMQYLSHDHACAAIRGYEVCGSSYSSSRLGQPSRGTEETWGAMKFSCHPGLSLEFFSSKPQDSV